MHGLTHRGCELLFPPTQLLWPHRKFPRNHRFVLGERIERNLYDMLEALIRAKYTKERLPILEYVNLSLEILRFQVRLAKDLNCLKVASYEFAAVSIDEIGRMVGGWMKSIHQRV